MYLAEDRILCFEVVARPQRCWILTYVSLSVAETDVPSTLLELMKQRRRWLNGSLFALLFYLINFPRFLRTRHSWVRKTGFMAQALMQALTAVLAWLAVANLLLTLLLIISSALDRATPDVSALAALRILFTFVYTGSLFIVLVFSLAGDISRLESSYWLISIVYAVMMMVVLVLSFWLVSASFVKIDISEAPLLILGLLGLGGSFVAAAAHGRLLYVLSISLQYMLFLPTLINVFSIYSLANTHDVSWGTKEGGALVAVPDAVRMAPHVSNTTIPLLAPPDTLDRASLTAPAPSGEPLPCSCLGVVSRTGRTTSHGSAYVLQLPKLQQSRTSSSRQSNAEQRVVEPSVVQNMGGVDVETLRRHVRHTLHSQAHSKTAHMKFIAGGGEAA